MANRPRTALFYLRNDLTASIKKHTNVCSGPREALASSNWHRRLGSVKDTECLSLWSNGQSVLFQAWLSLWSNSQSVLCVLFQACPTWYQIPTTSRPPHTSRELTCTPSAVPQKRSAWQGKERRGTEQKSCLIRRPYRGRGYRIKQQDCECAVPAPRQNLDDNHWSFGKYRRTQSCGRLSRFLRKGT